VPQWFLNPKQHHEKCNNERIRPRGAFLGLTIALHEGRVPVGLTQRWRWLWLVVGDQGAKQVRAGRRPRVRTRCGLSRPP